MIPTNNMKGFPSGEITRLPLAHEIAAARHARRERIWVRTVSILAFLFTVMFAVSRAFSATLPVIPFPSVLRGNGFRRI